MSLSEMLVTGGTGVLGRKVVERLCAAGVGTRVMSRGGAAGTVRGDLVSGEELDRAVRGIDTVIHCASSLYRKTGQTDVEGTKRLLRAAAGAGVGHVVLVSIVGIDRVRSYPYFQAKFEAERAAEASRVPHTILRATQFHDLVLTAIRFLPRLLVMPVLRGLPGQPIDSGEVVDRLVALALSEPVGRVPDIGGPEVLTMTDAARVYLRTTGLRKRLLEYRLPGKKTRAIATGALSPLEDLVNAGVLTLAVLLPTSLLLVPSWTGEKNDPGPR